MDDNADVLSRLGAALQSAGVDFVQTEHEAVFTSAEAAKIRGVELHSGAKALILKAGQEFLMAVLPADLALDSVTFRKQLHVRKMRFATKEEVLDMTGLTPGAIPPFGSLFGLKTYCDSGLADNQRINFNAGSHTNSFQMTYDDYVSFESPTIVTLARPADKSSG